MCFVARSVVLSQFVAPQWATKHLIYNLDNCRGLLRSWCKRKWLCMDRKENPDSVSLIISQRLVDTVIRMVLRVFIAFSTMLEMLAHYLSSLWTWCLPVEVRVYASEDMSHCSILTKEMQVTWPPGKYSSPRYPFYLHWWRDDDGLSKPMEATQHNIHIL